jgi:putative tricarboxylic transport membrane protein
MRRVHQITAGVVLLVAATLGYLAAGLRYYTPLGPGAGFFPVWLCGSLAVLALVLFAQASVRGDRSLPAGFIVAPSAYVRIVSVAVALFAVASALPVIGFRLSMFVFYVALLPLLGRRGIVETLVLAIVGSAGTFYVFVRYLSQPLPIGIFGI